jgi:hypothetical protein
MEVVCCKGGDGELLNAAGAHINLIRPVLTAREASPASQNSIGSALRQRQIGLVSQTSEETAMNEEVLNATVRKFLKKVGITSQREIELAVRDAVANGRLKGNESLLAKATVRIEGLNLSFDVEGDVELE